jgi:hypothetical protein
LTPWEFVMAVRGWQDANCPDETVKAPSAAEHEALMAKYG